MTFILIKVFNYGLNTKKGLFVIFLLFNFNLGYCQESNYGIDYLTSKKEINGVVDSMYIKYFPGTKQKMIENHFKDGKLNGKSKYWYKNGQLEQIVNYKNGVVSGLYRAYWENGSIKQESNWINGIQSGKTEFWYSNGKKEQEYIVKNGVKIGEALFYFENGKLKSCGVFINDQKNGEWKYYNIFGKLIEIITYDKDSIVNSIDFTLK